MSRSLQILVIVVCMAALVAFATYRVITGAGKQHGRMAVVVVDRSDSMRDACQAATGMAASLLAEGAWGRGSVLILLATGDDSTRMEPIELFRFDSFRRQKTIEGKSAGQRATRELLAAFEKACRSAPRTKTTPIWLAARRGIELLAASSCAPSRCDLVLVTDGDETAEAALVAAIRGKRAPRGDMGLPAKLDNRLIRVRICGFAETVSVTPTTPKSKSRRSRKAAADTRDSAKADRVAALWRELFVEPSSVEISPICPKSGYTP